MATDAQVRDERRTALELAGFTVTTAATFEEGRELLRTLRPAILIADVQLHSHNGLHLAMRAIHDSPRTRTVIVGYPDVVLERDARALGALYLATSDPRALLEAVDALR